jgi:hypothetical protein
LRRERKPPQTFYFQLPRELSKGGYGQGEGRINIGNDED